MVVVNIIALILVLVGAFNWGLIGLCGFNLVSFISGSDRNAFARIIYILVFAAAIWLIVSTFISGGILYFM
jgi:hypothetical protein